MYTKVTDKLCRLFGIQRQVYEKTVLLSSFIVEITKEDCYCSSCCYCTSDLVLTKITTRPDDEVLAEINKASDKKKEQVEKQLAADKLKKEKAQLKKLKKLNELGRELNVDWVDKTLEDIKEIDND